MTFWQFIDRCIDRLPGWPSERQVITYLNVALIWIMLRMARENGTLWNVELFKVILQALALTGFLNMAMAFFFVFIAITLGITYWAARRTQTTEHFYAAGRSISPGQNGFALAGDYTWLLVSYVLWSGGLAFRSGNNEAYLYDTLAAGNLLLAQRVCQVLISIGKLYLRLQYVKSSANSGLFSRLSIA